MKLIAEYNDSDITTYITEDKKGNKSHVIEGVFMQADAQNRKVQLLIWIRYLTRLQTSNGREVML